MNISQSPFAPGNLVSRDGFGSTVPRQPTYLHTQAEHGAYLRNSSRFPRRHPFIYFSPHTPSGESRVYRATQLRTDGVHCRESAGTGPVNPKVVPNGCCHSRSPWPNLYAPLFPTPSIGISGHVESTEGTKFSLLVYGAEVARTSPAHYFRTQSGFSSKPTTPATRSRGPSHSTRANQHSCFSTRSSI